jgi:hypothetical protein
VRARSTKWNVSMSILFLFFFLPFYCSLDINTYIRLVCTRSASGLCVACSTTLPELQFGQGYCVTEWQGGSEFIGVLNSAPRHEELREE